LAHYPAAMTQLYLFAGEAGCLAFGEKPSVSRYFILCSVTMPDCAAAADPGIQVADYCAWAIQRKWERGDARSYDLIADKIDHEHEVWRGHTTTYY
jgi:hypothetical protein